MRKAWLVALLLMTVAGPALAADCPPSGWSREQLAALKAAEFDVAKVPVAAPAAATPDALALALLACLGDRDPGVRDGIAFEATSHWLRAGALSQDTRARLLTQLLPMLVAPDPQGVRRPFAALVLSEVARSDRKAAWMTAAQRESVVAAAAGYMRGITDHRGFDAAAGWRHGVAHTADLMLQLVLNPAVDKAQLDRLLAALATQVSPPGHAYVFGEPDRLARPVLYAAQRNLHSEAEWKAWLDGVAAPAPFADWRSAVRTEAGLAKRHDVHAFLLALYAGAREDEDPAVVRLASLARAALDAE
jgi:hypothetical protein